MVISGYKVKQKVVICGYFLLIQIKKQPLALLQAVYFIDYVL